MKDRLSHGISEGLLQRVREKAQGIGEFVHKCWSVTERKRDRKVEKQITSLSRSRKVDRLQNRVKEILHRTVGERGLGAR